MQKVHRSDIWLFLFVCLFNTEIKSSNPYRLPESKNEESNM